MDVARESLTIIVKRSVQKEQFLSKKQPDELNQMHMLIIQKNHVFQILTQYQY